MPLYGPKFPLSKGNKDTFQLYEDINEQIGFYLKNLILTSPGENISDPNYGVGLRRYIFEQNIPSTRDRIASNISRQISRYLPYLSVGEVSVSASSDEIDFNTLNIRIVYSVPNDATQQIFDLNIEMSSTIGFY